MFLFSASNQFRKKLANSIWQTLQNGGFSFATWQIKLADFLLPLGPIDIDMEDDFLMPTLTKPIWRTVLSPAI